MIYFHATCLLKLFVVVVLLLVRSPSLYGDEPSNEALALRFRLAQSRGTENPAPEPLWPTDSEMIKASGAEERIVERGKEHLDRAVSNVIAPCIYVHQPDADVAIPTAIVVCPGGGYSHLAIDKAGHDIARWLNSVGITAIVLKYRLKEFGQPAPLQDVQRAVALTRHRAEELGFRPDRIGVMGFSAGAHLAACSGVHATSVTLKNGAVVSSRPDFLAIVCPLISMDGAITHRGARRNLLGKAPTQELIDYYSVERHVTGQCPPTFLVHCRDDRVVSIEHSTRMYRALERAGVAAEFVNYERGGHGFGLGRTGAPASEWPGRFVAWLSDAGFTLEPEKYMP